jgi:hypothetical protein
MGDLLGMGQGKYQGLKRLFRDHGLIYKVHR